VTSDQKADLVLERARKLASTAKCWMDFSNAIFGQQDSIVANTFTNPAERQAFYYTRQYEEIYTILGELMRRFGIGGTKAKSGKFVVRVPKSLHQALGIEAKSEGISLNQLIVSKLSTSLKVLTQVPDGR